MPEAIIFAAADVVVEAGLVDAEVAGTFLTATTLGATNASLIGSGLLLAASIGLQYALSRPAAPRAEDGSQPLRAPLQPRQRGYWINRLSGAVMLAASGGPAPTQAYMVGAFHSGPVERLLGYWFDDDGVTVTPDLATGGTGTVFGAGGKYTTSRLCAKLGHPGEGAEAVLTSDAIINPLWTAAFVGNGVAYWSLISAAPADPTQFAKLYPRGFPKPSLLVKCAPIWDPRDGTQVRDTASTWKASPNPVLQLLDYLCAVDGGMGFDIDEFCPPARLAQWMTEASLCDVNIGGGEIRYQSAGWYTFDTKPEDVINKILAACDGWLAPAGDGTLALTVGVYRAPSLPAITEGMVYRMQVSLGQPDETLVNQLDCAWTNPNTNYSTDQGEPIADAASIALVGEIKRQPLDLTWVQALPQVVRLGERALRRVNPARSGTFVMSLYGLRYAGERWIKLQFPFPGLEDCVVEVQDYQADILAGRVTIKFITVDPLIIAGTGF